jgi:hypothetical protein
MPSDLGFYSLSTLINSRRFSPNRVLSASWDALTWISRLAADRGPLDRPACVIQLAAT